MKAQIFIVEYDEFYFEVIKEVLESISLTFYPNSKEDFCQFRALLGRGFSGNDSIKKESMDKILQILNNNTDKETTFLVTCCLGENQEPTLEGLTFYEMFIKDCGGKTIIISSTILSEEIKTIENFCEKKLNCLLFRKSKNSLQKRLGKFLMEVRSDISNSESAGKLLNVGRRAERFRFDYDGNIGKSQSYPC
jgi:hypothetical protein